VRGILGVLLAACFVISTIGCSSETTSEVPGVSESRESSSAVEVDEGLLTVDVTFPAAYFDEYTEQEIREGAQSEGYQDVVIHTDGSVTYTMTRAKHREILGGLKQSVDETIEDMLDDPDDAGALLSVEYNDDMSEFTAKVDGSEYSFLDTMNAFVFYIAGMNYQAFDGVPPEDNHVVVTFVDAESGEILDTADSANMGE